MLFERQKLKYGGESCQKGFTLAELLVVIAIISSLALISLPSFSNFFNSSSLKYRYIEIEALFKNARQKNFSHFNDASYGVYFDKNNSKFIAYRGDSFLLRETSADIEISFEAALIFSSPENNLDMNFSNTNSFNKAQFGFRDIDGTEKYLTINKYSGIYK